MRYSLGNRGKRAFALPTVLIASVVLLTVLAVSVTATAAVRTTLKNQYYAQLAQVAGEAGVAYAKACLAANGNVPQWTDAKPLTPATDCTGTILASTASAQVLVVAGGGGGAGNCATCGGGGGGGAGGLTSSTGYALSKGTITVTVGGGGAGGTGVPTTGDVTTSTHGANGSNSVFGSLTAIGGGGGHAQDGSAGNGGGSGGGGSGGASPVAGTGGSGTVGQGNNGGAGVVSPFGGGGGGGAGGVGASGSTKAGGVGLASSIGGSSVYYAGGGGGGAYTTNAAGVGGNGGGGNGANQSTNSNTGNAFPGTDNTGGGGGGANGNPRAGNGGNGGSGVVIVRYPTSSLTATGGTITTSGSDTIHTFTSSGSFVVSAVDKEISCPTNPRCSVTVNGNIRSSFAVPKPSVDSNGKAVTIANTGYVEILRTSNGAVWRTFTQPSVQSAVVPDLCSGDATAARGWNAAVKATSQDSFSPASTAQTITMANSDLNEGYMYFRKDFSISTTGAYSLKVLTPDSKDVVEAFIDNKYIVKSNNNLASASVNLKGGCHTLLVRLNNQSVEPRVSKFTASLKKPGASVPIAVTDTTWRVTAGNAAHFSDVNFYADPAVWTDVRDFQAVANNPDDASGLRNIVTTHSYTGTSTYPSASYSYYRDKRQITLSQDTAVRISVACNDTCSVYVDGEEVMQGMASAYSTSTKTLTAGTHQFGIRLYNVSATSVVNMAVIKASDPNVIYTHTDPNWLAANVWTSSAIEPYSYEVTYRPFPVAVPTPTVKVLVVGGGGGGGSRMGGGGGGGGVVYDAGYTVPIGPIKVTVGGGGGGALAGTGQAKGINGGDSVFGTIRALGGGGGGSEYSANADISTPGSGASSGGTAGNSQVTPGIAFIGQGYPGGSGGGAYYPGGGGGAGAAGSTNPGNGGNGVVNTILGPSYYWGGGGGGSGYTGVGGNGGKGGGGGGAVGTTTGGQNGLVGGSPGGGGAIVTQANTPGGNGGANTGGGGGGGSHGTSNNYGGNGGSGIVIVSYPTGTITATGGTITCSGNEPPPCVGGNTIHTFYSNGTFTVVSVP